MTTIKPPSPVSRDKLQSPATGISKFMSHCGRNTWKQGLGPNADTRGSRYNSKVYLLIKIQSLWSVEAGEGQSQVIRPKANKSILINKVHKTFRQETQEFWQEGTQVTSQLGTE